jgi:hypothetical protein
VPNPGCAPADLLSSPQPGDFAVLQPPPSKSDPFDMVWGSKPIFLPFSSDPLSAFTSLADIHRMPRAGGYHGEVAILVHLSDVA